MKKLHQFLAPRSPSGDRGVFFCKKNSNGCCTLSGAAALAEFNFASVLAKETIFAHRCPLEVHFLIVVFDETLNLAQFPVSQNPAILYHSVSIAFYKEFCSTALSQFTVTGMDVQTFNDAVRGKLKIVTANFEIIIFRHYDSSRCFRFRL